RITTPSLHDALPIFDEIGQGDLPLHAGCHVPQGGLSGLQLFLPEEHGIAGSDRVRVVEVLRRSPPDEVDVRGEACGPEGREDLDRLPLGTLSDRHDVRIEWARRLDCLLRLRRHDETVDAEGEAGLRDALSAEDL